jgi:hypothetical protein
MQMHLRIVVAGYEETRIVRYNAVQSVESHPTSMRIMSAPNRLLNFSELLCVKVAEGISFF